VILQKGAIARSTMKGSWAGAMGGPQFLPSTYLAHAVSYDSRGAPNIWTNVPDVFASIAKYLKDSGWVRGARWGFEVQVPAHFDYARLHADFSTWRALGFAAVDGRSLPANGNATLFFPAGAKGPAFLLAANYWVIKTYNNSDAYALSLGCLADRIAGAPGLHRPWPHEKIWQHDQRAEMQRLLKRLGFYKGVIDGRFGPTSRDAIHAFQVATGDEPADGIGGPDLLERIRAKAGQ
jgi:peptidoglycan lytic transglycosylase B